MAKCEGIISVPDEVIMSKLYLIRGKKVMLDRDLAEPVTICDQFLIIN